MQLTQRFGSLGALSKRTVPQSRFSTPSGRRTIRRANPGQKSASGKLFRLPWIDGKLGIFSAPARGSPTETLVEAALSSRSSQQLGGVTQPSACNTEHFQRALTEDGNL